MATSKGRRGARGRCNDNIAGIYLGVDCAYSTLGMCLMVVHKMPEIDDCIRMIKYCMDNDMAVMGWILSFGLVRLLRQQKKIISAGVYDTIGGRKVGDLSDVERARALKSFMETSPYSCSALEAAALEYGLPVKVFIEHQPPRLGVSGHGYSYVVGHQLAFYYATANVEVAFVSPKLKNKLALADTFDNVHAKMGGAQSTKYRARKKHSTMNAVEFHRRAGIPLPAVPAGCLDDYADSLNTILVNII